MKTKFFLLAILMLGLFIQKSSGQYWQYNAVTLVSLQNPTLLENDDVAPIIFGTNSTQEMILTTNGLLGIGPASFGPGWMLDVDGNIDIYPSTSGLRTGGGTGAQYLLYAGTATTDNLFVGVGSATGASAIDNTFVGANAGAANTGGSEDTYIGSSAANASGFASVSNTVCLGYDGGVGANTIGSNSIYVGNSSTGDAYVYNSVWSSYSDRRIKDNIKENVPGLAFINKLHPVTYNLNVHRENQLTGVTDNKDWPGKYDVEKITQSGFIAQQVDSAAQACGYDFNGVKRPKSPQGLYALAYSNFVMPLVKAAQELSMEDDSLSYVLQTMQICLNQLCETNGGNALIKAPFLYQNTPNPVSSGATQINYYLPEGTTGASLVFYDTYGNPIKSVQLNQTGNGTLNINSDNLSNGTYSYSLIVDSDIISTQKMVLQR